MSKKEFNPKDIKPITEGLLKNSQVKPKPDLPKDSIAPPPPAKPKK